jgi:hypothetical protein
VTPSVRLVVLALAIALPIAGCVHFSAVDELPPAMKARLSRHPMWLTVAILDHRKGTFPPSETTVVKKWEVVEEHGEPVRLKELFTSSFIGMFEKLHAGELPFGAVDLDGAMDLTAFLPYPDSGLEVTRRFASDRYAYQDLDGRRFQLLVNGGRMRIVFVPAPNDYFAGRSAEGIPESGIWTTPFGAESELLAQVKRALIADGEKVGPDEGVFLHHDLSVRRQLTVVLDKSFPPALAGAAARAAALWNQGFGRDLLRVDSRPRATDAADCQTAFKICLKWLGPPDLAFTGANGYTNMAFDPQTGLILGATVTIVNDDVQPPLGPMAPPDRAKVVEHRIDWDWVADAMHRYGELNRVSHPEPVAEVEYLLLHEFGHASGFGHNFYLTGATTPTRPITSVMSYPPFPVGYLSTYLGEADLARLAVVYGKAPPHSLPYCSTFDAMVPRLGDGGIYRKPPHCDLFTVGDQADWYIRLARHGRFGVFTGYPDLSHLSEELRSVYEEEAEKKGLPPLNVLTRLGFILADGGSERRDATDHAKINAFLCALKAEREAIAAQLATYNRVTLQCKDP